MTIDELIEHLNELRLNGVPSSTPIVISVLNDDTHTAFTGSIAHLNRSNGVIEISGNNDNCLVDLMLKAYKEGL
jgi:hypothetical protein